MRKALDITIILALITLLLAQAAHAGRGTCLRVPMKYSGENSRRGTVQKKWDPKWRQLDEELRGLEQALRLSERGKRISEEATYYIRGRFDINFTAGLSESLIAYDSLVKKIISLMQDDRQQLVIYPASGADRIIERHRKTFCITNNKRHRDAGKLLLRYVFRSVIRGREQSLLDCLEIENYNLARSQYPNRQLILMVKDLYLWPVDEKNREELEAKRSEVLRNVASNLLGEGDFILALTADDIDMLADIGLTTIRVPSSEDFSFEVGKGEDAAEFVLPNAVGIFRKRSGILEPVYCEPVDVNKEDALQIRMPSRAVEASD